jgi:hypothetical protein
MSVIERFRSVPFWTAGDPGTGVSGSTLGRCDEENGATWDAAAGAVDDAPVILGVNFCGSLVVCGAVVCGNVIVVATAGCKGADWAIVLAAASAAIAAAVPAESVLDVTGTWTGAAGCATGSFVLYLASSFMPEIA